MIEKVFHLFKIVKEYFTDTHIRLKNLDAAFVIREDGVQELYTPKLPNLPDDDIVPENMLLLISVAYNMRDEKWIDDTVSKLTEGLGLENLGGESGSTETGNSLPDSWAGHDTSTISKSSPDFLHFIEREKASDALKKVAEVGNSVPNASSTIYSTFSIGTVSNLHFTVTEEEQAWIDATNKETLRRLEEVEKEVDKAK